MQLLIENWSDGRLVQPAWIYERIKIRREKGLAAYEFAIAPSDWEQYPYFTKLLPEIVVPEPIYILKLRPQDQSSVDPFEEWLAVNNLDLHAEELRPHRDPARVVLHADLYGDKLHRLVTGDLEIPLVSENIVGYKSVETVRRELKEGRRMSREQEV